MIYGAQFVEFHGDGWGKDDTSDTPSPLGWHKSCPWSPIKQSRTLFLVVTKICDSWSQADLKTIPCEWLWGSNYDYFTDSIDIYWIVSVCYAYIVLDTGDVIVFRYSSRCWGYNTYRYQGYKALTELTVYGTRSFSSCPSPPNTQLA